MSIQSIALRVVVNQLFIRVVTYQLFSFANITDELMNKIKNMNIRGSSKLRETENAGLKGVGWGEEIVPPQ